MNHVVDRTALLFFSVGSTEVHPIACVHSCTGGGSEIFVAFELEGGEPGGGKVEDKATELFIDPNVCVYALEDGVIVVGGGGWGRVVFGFAFVGSGKEFDVGFGGERGDGFNVVWIATDEHSEILLELEGAVSSSSV